MRYALGKIYQFENAKSQNDCVGHSSVIAYHPPSRSAKKTKNTSKCAAMFLVKRMCEKQISHVRGARREIHSSHLSALLLLLTISPETSSLKFVTFTSLKKVPKELFENCKGVTSTGTKNAIRCSNSAV